MWVPHPYALRLTVDEIPKNVIRLTQANKVILQQEQRLTHDKRDSPRPAARFQEFRRDFFAGLSHCLDAK